jgi:5-methylcytosine-specific restriction endonuclease McrA
MARFRVTATVQWEIETSRSSLAEKQEQERAKLESLVHKEFPDARIFARTDKLKDKIQKVHLGEFEPDLVLPFITKDDSRREYTIDEKTYSVRMNSHRYFIFRENMACVACGVVGEKMILEQHPHDKNPHFNLYAYDGNKAVLMTKDHIQPKSCGGEDIHSNYQTMCIVCNNLKGSTNMTLEGIATLRTVYDENKGRLTKKNLHLLIEDTKNQLEQPWPANLNEIPKKTKNKRAARRKARADAVETKCDLNLWRYNGETVGRSVYDELPEGMEHFGCIRRGTELEPLAAHAGRVLVQLSEDEVFYVPQLLVKEIK